LSRICDIQKMAKKRKIEREIAIDLTGEKEFSASTKRADTLMYDKVWVVKMTISQFFGWNLKNFWWNSKIFDEIPNFLMKSEFFLLISEFLVETVYLKKTRQCFLKKFQLFFPCNLKMKSHEMWKKSNPD